MEALRDIIQSYKLLLEDKKILYWDIFENNIIIIEFFTKDTSKGKLINLDLIKELNGIPSRVRY